MRNTIMIVLFCLVTIMTTALATADESADRLAEMRRRVEELQLMGAHADAARFRSEPLLRYSDPTRDVIDASVWSLGVQGRPQAILVLERYQDARQYWSYELTVTSKRIVEILRGPGWIWRPTADEFEWIAIKSPPPGASKIKRGRQMKDIARKLKASETYGGQTYQLRLMPRPLIRYSDEAAGIVDGNIFVLAHGTNAELLVLIEARRERSSGNASWQAGFARLGAAPLEVTMDAKPIWSADFGSSRSYLLAQQDISDAAEGLNGR